MSEEYEEESLVFVNDEGEETEFTILRSLEHEGKEYILVTENPDSEDVEVQILRLDGEEETDDEEGSLQVFNTIEDLEELKAVSALFSELFEDDNIDIIVEE